MAKYRNGTGRRVVVEAEPGELCEQCKRRFNNSADCKLFVLHALRGEFVKDCKEHEPELPSDSSQPTSTPKFDAAAEEVMGALRTVIHAGVLGFFLLVLFLIVLVVAPPAAFLVKFILSILF